MDATVWTSKPWVPQVHNGALGQLFTREAQDSVIAFYFECQLKMLIFFCQQGEQLCVFYSRYGICKYGPNCKFDHPMGPVPFGLSTSSSSDVPVVRRLLGSSSGSAALPLSSEGPAEAAQGRSRRLSLSESRQMTSGDENIEGEGSHSSSIGPVSSYS